MIKKLAFTALVVCTAFNVAAIEINESMIIELTKNSTPSLDRIKSQRLMGKKDLLVAQDNLAFKLYGGYQHETTREKAINPFIPVFSPINQYKLGVSKNYKYGMNSKLEASVDSRTANGFNSINTSIVSLELGFDLWSDFLGRMSKRQLENASLSNKQKKLKEQIDMKVFESNTRKLYWAMVANAQKYKLTQRLLETAQKQARDAKKRQKKSIADNSEVARYQSQVSLREGQLLLLKYEKENLVKNLKTTFPSLNGESIDVARYNLDKTVSEILSCTQVIGSKKSAPYDYTFYDEIVSLLSNVQKNQEIIDESSSIDVQLTTKFKTTGVGSNETAVGSNRYEGSFQDSLDDIDNNNRSGFEAGLVFNIPLGSTSEDLKEVNKLINKKRLTAELKEVDANLISTHTQISNAIKILSNVMKTQKTNARSLNTRVKDMRKKYSQARIPLYALIQDEDELMNNDLNIIDTQLTILNTLLDYFIVFSETPCAFNRK